MSEETLHTPHTPLPWMYEQFKTACIVEATDGRMLFSASPETQPYENIANAEYIIEACNSHYTLLEANKRKDALLRDAAEFLQGSASIAGDRGAEIYAFTARAFIQRIAAELAGTPQPLPSERELALADALQSFEDICVALALGNHHESKLYEIRCKARALLTKKDGEQECAHDWQFFKNEQVPDGATVCMKCGRLKKDGEEA